MHGCCHNPTGANLNNDQWKELQKFLCDNQLVPLIDLAYQGFGDGLDEDAYGVRLLAKKMQRSNFSCKLLKKFWDLQRKNRNFIYNLRERKN